MLTEDGLDAQEAYREALVAAIQTTSRDYDRALLTLSGGALVLSIAFVSDLAPKPVSTYLLVGAWICFVLSIIAITVAYLFSDVSLRTTLNQLDSGETEKLGGWASRLTQVLNILAAVALFVGAILLVLFAIKNLEGG